MITSTRKFDDHMVGFGGDERVIWIDMKSLGINHKIVLNYFNAIFLQVLHLQVQHRPLIVITFFAKINTKAYANIKQRMNNLAI